MDSRWSLRKQNTGASLIAVIIALVVVGIIGMLIAHLTITNIQMKEVESSSKKNFYQTEKYIDEISVKLNSDASDCMQAAYLKILGNYSYYSSSTSGPGDMQDKFAQLYLENLVNKLWDGTSTVVDLPGHTADDPYHIVTLGKMTYYDVDHIKTAITTTSGVEVLTAPKGPGDTDYTNDPLLYVDLIDNTVRLKNVIVRYKDNADYETTITTDIVFETPKLNFRGKNKVTDYMKYALIADEEIYVNVSPVKVNGNVYAGPGGIVSDLGSTGEGSNFTGNTIITRGDIASSGGKITVGKDDGTSSIWAENVCTTSGAGNITLQGNSYIADDLTLNARGSNVTLKGEYYGYNFQKKYGSLTTTKDADFSSAMIINAKGSKLDISGLSYLLLAGRTFISSGNSGNDVMMGESVSVRANQFAYYVDISYLEKDATGKRAQKNAAGNVIGFSAEGKTAYIHETGMSDIDSYLKTAPDQQIVEYTFIDTVAGGPQYYYYLNFKDEQSANNFYAAYVNRNKTESNDKAEEYLKNTGLQLNPTIVLTLKGDILYRDAAGSLQEGAVSIATGDWNVDGVYWDYAKNLAIRYKSLQLSLTETETGITGEDVRFSTVDASGKEVIDKTMSNVFDTIVDRTAIESDIHDNDIKYCVGNSSSAEIVVFANNEDIGSDVFHVKNGRKGVVVATGDVYVEGTFEGMIVSGGTVSFASGATVTGDSVLVADLFQRDANLGASATFIKYFKGYGTLEENVIGTVEVSDYLSFQNWQKN